MNRGIFILFLLWVPALFSKDCHSDYFNLEVSLQNVSNHAGKSLTILPAAKRNGPIKVKKNISTVLNKTLMKSINTCNGLPIQQIATISAGNKQLAQLWFALIEHGNKKYTIQAIITGPVGSKIKYKDLIAVDTVRYYKPGMYEQLNVTINLTITGKKIFYHGNSITEIRNFGLELVPPIQEAP